MIRINPFFLRQRSYHFRSNWSYIYFPFQFKSFYVFPRPLRPRKMDKFLFLGTHTRFVTKRIMVTPPLTTSFMNLIVIKIHVLPRQNL
uniref:Ycf15 n=1 Tax=Angelica tsinlingensis TaxID=357858 RepID=A0A2L1K1C5_9APIA|nr:Ycf15 [Angelica tsinlingensis]